MTKTIEEAFMIKNDSNLYYNGGYTYEETEDVFSGDSSYAKTFSSEKEALKVMLSIKAYFSYLMLEKIYI